MCQKGLEGRLSEHVGLYGVILKCKNVLSSDHYSKNISISPNYQHKHLVLFYTRI